jgi:tetratricopeptide (TPR) repeat protein
MIAIDVPIWAARLEATRHGRLWSRTDLASRLVDAADEAARDRLSTPETLTSMIGLWESGDQRPDELCSELLCRAFDVDESELFVGDAAGTTLWHHLTGIPLQPGMFNADEEERTGRAVEAPERADEGTVRYFKALLDAYARTDLRPADLSAAFRAIFAGIKGFHRDASSPVRQALVTLAAENAELISRMHHEAGDPDGAVVWSDEAIRDAREAADRLLEAYTLAQRAGLLDTFGDPGQMVDLAVAAREHLHLPPQVDALSRDHEAQGHALAGDRDLCHGCLEESARSLAESGGDTPSPFNVSAQAHNALCAGCLVDLGCAGDAIEILEQEPARRPPSYVTAYALARMAHAYAEARERERSAETARQALALARQSGAARAMRELARIKLPPTDTTHRRILI